MSPKRKKMKKTDQKDLVSSPDVTRAIPTRKASAKDITKAKKKKKKKPRKQSRGK